MSLIESYPYRGFSRVRFGRGPKSTQLPLQPEKGNPNTPVSLQPMSTYINRKNVSFEQRHHVLLGLYVFLYCLSQCSVPSFGVTVVNLMSRYELRSRWRPERSLFSGLRYETTSVNSTRTSYVDVSLLLV